MTVRDADRASEPEEVGPGVHWLTDGVHVLSLPLPDKGLKAVNVYVVESGDELVVVDAGWPSEECWDSLVAGLAVLGATPADVGVAVVTHAHRDHYPQAVKLRRRFGAEVALSLGEQASIHAIRAGDRPFGPQLAQLRLAGDEAMVEQVSARFSEVEVDLDEWEEPDHWLSIGALERVPGLTAIATPGHTVGHLCFVDDGRGLMFAGDHVLPHITPSIGFQPVTFDLALAAYLSSLALVRALPDRRLLPGHGPVTGSVHARVDALLEHHRIRLAACAHQVRKGAATGLEVAQRLRWTRHERSLEELDDFNHLLAVCETVAHLDVLVARGDLDAGEVDGVRRYRPTS
jgi:glyoxylase-like metal-dependent hydrolase (beta-lactamase superfamily II)